MRRLPAPRSGSLFGLHVADLLVPPDVVHARRHVVVRVVVVVHEQPLAEAVAAVGAAHLVAQQQGRVDVLVLHSPLDGVGLLVARVELAVVGQLSGMRDDELADRIVGVRPVDESGVVVVEPEGVALGHRRESAAFVFAKSVEPIESGDVSDAPFGRRRRGRRCGCCHPRRPLSAVAGGLLSSTARYLPRPALYGRGRIGRHSAAVTLLGAMRCPLPRARARPRASSSLTGSSGASPAARPGSETARSPIAASTRSNSMTLNA